MVEEIGRLRGHVGAVKALQVEDHVCLTGGEDGAVRVWDLRRVGAEDARENLGNITEESDAMETETEDGEGERLSRKKANGVRSSEDARTEDGPCARVLEGHSKAVTALYFEENCLVRAIFNANRPAVALNPSFDR
jgi:division protein 1